MEITSKVRFHFDVSQNEFKLIINALKSKGGNGIMLAAELESARAKHFKEIHRRFGQWISTNEGSADMSREGGGE